jgi:hypothetical protein
VRRRLRAVGCPPGRAPGEPAKAADRAADKLAKAADAFAKALTEASTARAVAEWTGGLPYDTTALVPLLSVDPNLRHLCRIESQRFAWWWG